MLDGIYCTLKSLGMVKCHAEFSVEFLCRDARHFDYLRCTRSKPTIETLTRLAVRLNRVSSCFRKDGRWIDLADKAEELAKDVWAEVVNRSANGGSRELNPLLRPLKC